ncbi:hypothetical protein VTK26DRAFT_2789 [Humicola hyalothermophila]
MTGLREPRVAVQVAPSLCQGWSQGTGHRPLAVGQSRTAVSPHPSVDRTTGHCTERQSTPGNGARDTPTQGQNIVWSALALGRRRESAGRADVTTLSSQRPVPFLNIVKGGGCAAPEQAATVSHDRGFCGRNQQWANGEPQNYQDRDIYFFDLVSQRYVVVWSEQRNN